MNIIIGAGVKLTEEQVARWPIFADWASRKKGEHTVTVNAASVDKKGTIYSLHLTLHAKPWDHQFTLRSETVDVVVVVSDGAGRRSVIFVDQYREALGKRVISNVAGGREAGETQEQAATHEVREELGLPKSVKLSLSLLHRQKVDANPGSINEQVWFFRCNIACAPAKYDAFIKKLHGKRAGVKSEGEDILVHAIDEADLKAFKAKLTDAKTLLGLGMAGF